MSETPQDGRPAGERLGERYRTAAKRFLQTAIVVDDAAFLGPATVISAEPLATPTGSVLGDAGEQSVVVLEQRTAIPAAGLNAKVLSDAFLREDMICGVYKPVVGEDMVERTVRASRLADIVVVDWNLEHGSSRSAKDIIVGLLKEDAAEQGRLRLIAVYTSQPGLAASAGELLAEIEAQEVIRGSLLLQGAALVGRDTRVVFLNKRGASAAANPEAIGEESLPPRLVDEFAKLGQGMLASFALSSAAAVRRGVHHVLALYGTHLDAAFAAHRCGIPNPEDAEAFAIDLMSSELRNLVEVDEVARSHVGAEAVALWIEKRIAEGHLFRTDEAEIPSDVVRGFLDGGSGSVADTSNRHHIHGDAGKKARKAVSAGRLARTFYPGAAEATEGTRMLARLSAFQREAGRSHYPDSWLPTLSLGTVIQLLADGAGTGPILVCMQPRCDSVRLKEAVSFPFQTVAVDGDAFNLVLRDAAGEVRETWVNLKPRDATMVAFEAHQARGMVTAARDAGGRYAFRDAAGKTYAWLGDLKDMKAQRWASDLGARVNAVGMEEFEWLRWAGEQKFKRNWT